MSKPIFNMLVGLPASGKSNFIKEELINVEVHSSDSIREELLGDINSQQDNNIVFKTLHERIKRDLKDCKNVVYDATNISYKKRMGFLKELKNIECEKVCFVIMTPYEQCLEQNNNRNRIVPEHVIKRMYLNFDIPAYFEGWDSIVIVWNNNTSPKDLYELKFFDQHNSHHSLSLGDHCIETYNGIYNHCINNDIDMYDSDYYFHIWVAARYHDIGKVFTKQFKNSKGEETSEAHYYQHEHVSAYESLFHLHPYIENERILDICQLIRWHMYPYNIKQEKTKNKFIKLVGQEFYDRLMILHEADKSAH